MNTTTPTAHRGLSESELKNIVCLEAGGGYCASADITADDGRVHGFAAAQYLGYILEPNPSADAASPERMTLHYATADVVILGRQLNPIAGALSRSRLEMLQPISARYAPALNLSPFIISTNCLQMANPNPVPPKRRLIEPSACENA